MNNYYNGEHYKDSTSYQALKNIIKAEHTKNKDKIAMIDKYLNRTYYINQLINAKITEIKKLKDLSCSLSSPFAPNKIIVSNQVAGNAQYTNIVDKIVEYESQANRYINELIQVKNDVQKIICSLEDYEDRTIIELRYLNYKSWDKIAEQVGYTTRHIYRKRNDILLHIYRQIKDVIECQYY